MRWLLGLTVLVVRGEQAKNAELLVLRHENAVLRRNAGRVPYEPVDRAWYAVLTRFIPLRRWAEVFPVTPATLLAWHRRLAASKYDTSHRAGPAGRRRSRALPGSPSAWRTRTRPGVTGDYHGRRRPSWAPRSRRPPSSRSCAPPASNPRREGTAQPGGSSCTPQPPGSSPPAFLHVDTVSLSWASVLVFIEHGTHRMHIGGITTHPAGDWTVRRRPATSPSTSATSSARTSGSSSVTAARTSPRTSTPSSRPPAPRSCAPPCRRRG